jgi:hypothetical protein
MICGFVAWLGFGVGLVGTATTIWALCFARSHTLKKLTVDLTHAFRLYSSSIGLHGHLSFTYNGSSVNELRGFFLRITNTSWRDMLEEIDPAKRPSGVIFPRVSFDGFRIAGYHTINNNPEDFYIALSKSAASGHPGDYRTLWLNIRSMRSKKSAEFLIVGVPDPAIAEEDIRATLHVGYVPDLLITGTGILRPAD